MCAADLAALSESLRTYLLFVAEESLEQVARAVQYAHERGVLYCDL